MEAVEFIKDIDTKAFLFLNGKHSDFMDTLMYWLSDRFIWIPLYIILAYLLFKQFGRKVWFIALAAGLLILCSDQTCNLIKNVVMRYRPCHNELIKDMVHLVNGCGGKYGFVSSHAANTFALITFLAPFFVSRKYLIGSLYVWAGLVSYSRIYNGVHYPLDIIGGVMVGVVWAIILYRLYLYIETKIPNE